MQCRSGDAPAAAQEALRDTLRKQGYFLACQCPATDELDIVQPGEGALFSPATVREKQLLAANVCRLRLESATALYYHAGQFINVRRADGLTRSYSLASLPQTDEYLELHIRRRPNGAMCNWMFDLLAVGEQVAIQGPIGSCYYLNDRPDTPLLLIATGTGLAPLLGIARDALHAGHRGPIHLYHGSSESEGLYCGEELQALSDAHSHFAYTRCVSRGAPTVGYESGRADAVAFGRHGNLKGWRIYLCGAPPMVHAAKKWAYLAGAAIADIYADAFETRELRAQPRD